MKTLLLTILVIFLKFNFLFAQWQQLTQLSMTGNPRISVADSNVVWVAGGSANTAIVFRTVNGGLNWTSIPTTGLPYFLMCIAAKDSMTAFVADVGGPTGSGGNAKFYKTTNAGLSWIIIDSTGGTTGFFNDIQFSKSNPQIGIAFSDPHNGPGGPFNLWKTTNGGSTWIRTSPPGRQGCFGYYYASFIIDSQFYGFLVANASSLFVYPYITTNGGSTWFYGSDSLLTTTSADIVFNNNKLNGVIVTGSQMPVIKRTTDGGLNWFNTNTGVSGEVFTGACWVSGSNVIFIGASGASANNIIRSDDNGANWTVQNTSTAYSTREIDYVTYGNRLIAFAVNSNGTILKTRQTFVPIGIHPVTSEIPVQFKLFQNYPNPFNPVTKIKFELPQSGDVKLTLYDLLGREVAVLVNEKLSHGTYEVDFDGTNHPSGVYYYKLITGDYTETKKMVLVK